MGRVQTYRNKHIQRYNGGEDVFLEKNKQACPFITEVRVPLH